MGRWPSQVAGTALPFEAESTIFCVRNQSNAPTSKGIPEVSPPSVPSSNVKRRASIDTRLRNHGFSGSQAAFAAATFGPASTDFTSTVWPRVISIRRGFSASGTSRTRSMCSMPFS